MSDYDISDISYEDLDFPQVKILKYSFVHTHSPQWNNPNRNAPFWRFYWSQTPGAAILLDGKRLELTPAIIVLIPPHTSYASEAHVPFNQFYIHFEWDWESGERQPIQLPAESGKNFLPYLSDWVTSDRSSHPLRFYSVLLEILREVLQRPIKRQQLDPRIIQAINLMNSLNKCSNDEISRQLHMSRDHYLRLFTRQMGISPQRYMLGRRMDKAQSLLLLPNKSIDEIADLTGFADRYQFSKSFKSFFKIPPAAYRKKFH